jgi:hypothetical protein
MSKNKYIIVFIGFIIFSFLIGNYNKKRKKNLLSSKTEIVKGVFQRSYTQINTGVYSIFKSKINNQEKYFEIYDFSDFLKKGDTVLIKYSIEDPSIAEVADFCYMKKHKGKCN